MVDDAAEVVVIARPSRYPDSAVRNGACRLMRANFVFGH
jgi:hypothetical protein